MTNPIGRGTVNFNVNLCQEEKQILGRMALRSDVSLGEFLRRLIQRGLASQDPEAAMRITAIRRRHRQARQ